MPFQDLKLYEMKMRMQQPTFDTPSLLVSLPRRHHQGCYNSTGTGMSLQNVSTKCHGNPSNSCLDLSVNNVKCQHHGGTTEKAKGSPIPLGFIVEGQGMSV